MRPPITVQAIPIPIPTNLSPALQPIANAMIIPITKPATAHLYEFSPGLAII